MKNISGTVKEIIIAAHLNLYSKPLKKIQSNGKVKKTKVKGLISNCKIHITSQVLYCISNYMIKREIFHLAKNIPTISTVNISKLVRIS